MADLEYKTVHQITFIWKGWVVSDLAPSTIINTEQS